MLLRSADLLARHARGIIFCLACFIGVAAALSHWTIPLENKLEEIRNAAVKKSASGETVVVAIDSQSLSKIGAWPWPRGIHGRLTDVLREAGARQVAFDLTFINSAADPEQDLVLAAAVERAHGQVILPAVLENADGQYGERVEMLPIPALRSHARIGTIWARLDDDLYARHLPYSAEIAGAARPSLAAYSADRPTERSGQFHLDWSIDPMTIPTISYADVLAGRFESGYFQDKNVLIGVTSVTLGDRLSVPNHGVIPGVYIQAIGSETLRRGDPLPVGAWPALVVACCLIGASLVFRRQSYRFAALGGTLAAILVLPPLIREYSPYILQSAPAVLAVSAAILLSVVASIAAAVMARVTRAPASQLPNLTAMALSNKSAMTTVAVRLRNHVETTAHLGPEAQGELLRAVSARLSFAASNAPVYQVDDHSFAWRTDSAVEETREAIEGLHGLFASGISVGGRTVDVTITVGICEDSSFDTEAAVAAALVAANRAEQRGVSWERYESQDDADWRLSLLGELDRGIDCGDVWVAYQPQYDLRTCRLTGAEALVRWYHPERGNIRPDEFIPVLEESDRIEKLTLHVLDTALRDFAGVDDSLSVAVNISMRLIGRGRLVAPIRSLLSKHGVEAHRLTLEITESATMVSAGGIKELSRLCALGVKISIDDYGTGQSTLSYLKKLPAAELKIDRSFVNWINRSRSDATMVDSTIKLAHALGLNVVAEGVETQEVFSMLEDMHCDVIQGNFIGAPVPIQRLAKQLAAQKSARSA